MVYSSTVPPDVLDKLRKALERSPLTQAEISRKSGLQESVISRFRGGKTAVATLTLASAQKIANAIGHRLVLERVKGKKTAKKGGR